MELLRAVVQLGDGTGETGGLVTLLVNTHVHSIVQLNQTVAELGDAGSQAGRRTAISSNAHVDGVVQLVQAVLQLGHGTRVRWVAADVSVV